MEKKALLISSNRWNSAITEYMISTAHALQSRGWHVHLLITQSPAVVNRCTREKLTFTSWDKISLASFRAYTQLLHAQNPDWILAFGGPESWLLWRTPKKPQQYLTRFFGYEFTPTSFSGLQRRFFSSFHSVVFPCDTLRTACTWIAEERKHTVPLGLSTGRFFPACTDSAWQTSPSLLIFGRLDPVKGHATFLSLFAQFLLRLRKTSCPLPRLDIVGKPANTSREELETLAEGLGIAAQVQFHTEQVENVAQLLSSATLGVVCSLGSELICRVAQEFLLCGTPVFLSDAGALSEVLFPQSGVSYSLGKDQEILSLLETQYETALQESLEMRHARARVAKERFSFEMMGCKLEQVIEPGSE